MHLLFLEVKRRVIANFTAASKANIIHGTQDIYNPYSNKSNLVKTLTFLYLHFLVMRNQKESPRNIYSKLIDNITFVLHETYTIHIIKFTLPSKHTHVLILSFLSHRDNYSHFIEPIRYMLHETYTIHIWKFTHPSKHTRPYIVVIASKEKSRSYKLAYICPWITCTPLQFRLLQSTNNKLKHNQM